MAPIFNIAAFLYPGGDMLDFIGPLEVYTTLPPPGAELRFKSTTFAHKSPVKASAEAITIVPDATFEEIEANLENYDILLIPGAGPEIINELLEKEDGKRVVQLIKRFTELKPRQETGHRIIQSVCSGAIFLGASGILEGRTVTTHHMCFDLLKEHCDKAAGGVSETKIVRKRWSDAGKTDADVRIVNAGGVSSGLDASLYIKEMLIGKESMEWTANIVEHERRDQDAGWVSGLTLG
jgi:putative intracellular protease/amidase